MNTDETSSLCDIKYKIVMLGSISVGKSSIIERFIKDSFDEKHNQTVGIDFLSKNITKNQCTYKLQFWDTAGQQKFKSLIPSYIKDADCAVFVYDINRRETFIEIDSWIQIFKNNQQDSVLILVGNKNDQQRSVKQSDGKKFADKMKMGFCQVSAKTAEGIQILFNSILDNINYNKLSQSLNEQNNQRVNKTNKILIKSQKKHPCCYI